MKLCNIPRCDTKLSAKLRMALSKVQALGPRRGWDGVKGAAGPKMALVCDNAVTVETSSASPECGSCPVPFQRDYLGEFGFKLLTRHIVEIGLQEICDEVRVDGWLQQLNVG